MLYGAYGIAYQSDAQTTPVFLYFGIFPHSGNDDAIPAGMARAKFYLTQERMCPPKLLSATRKAVSEGNKIVVKILASSIQEAAAKKHVESEVQDAVKNPECVNKGGGANLKGYHTVKQINHDTFEITLPTPKIKAKSKASEVNNKVSVPTPKEAPTQASNQIRFPKPADRKFEKDKFVVYVVEGELPKESGIKYPSLVYYIAFGSAHETPEAVARYGLANKLHYGAATDKFLAPLVAHNPNIITATPAVWLGDKGVFDTKQEAEDAVAALKATGEYINGTAKESGTE